MTEPQWMTGLKHALAVNDSQFAQLATLGKDGRPANRTVVFRRFDDEPLSLLFTTDFRSAKASELRLNEAAELCWWFSVGREQFRISGRAYLSDGPDSPRRNEARAAIWESLSPAAKQTFTWPTPGEPLAEGSAFVGEIPSAIPSNFALLILVPHRVDHLSLVPTPHAREIHTIRPGTSEWSIERVNP